MAAGARRLPRFRFGAWLSALVIAATVAAGNFGLWAWVNQPAPAPDVDAKVKGFAYSGFQRHQNPLRDRFPTQDELAADVQLLARHTDRIRTYSVTENAAVLAYARQLNLKVTAGAWLDRRQDHNAREIAALVRAARSHRNIDQVIVGNETVLRNDLSPKQLAAYIRSVKSKVKVPVTTAEPWHVWLKNPELARSVDFITVHLLPYWEGVPVEAAVDHVFLRLEELQKVYPRKKIVIGEVGWPSNGDRVKLAIASPANQALFTREFLDRVQGTKVDYFLMEAFDQPWKISEEGRAGGYWGMFHADRTPKYPLSGPVIADPAWQAKAALASLAAVPFMLWFALAFRRFRLAGKVFFAALIQASVALVVWLTALPLEFYLRPVDWAMLAILIPALIAMLGVLLANGFEFTEVLWRGKWKREFGPKPLTAGNAAPFVSVHLACCNEPPEMVILTLESLQRLDYPSLEVIVVDNNTRDDALWQPVEAWCQAAGERFRFFHLPKWPGFKAGALNFALEETDPRAEVVGVVDADYVVTPDWLSSLMGHFEEPRVAVVQAPQAHRDFEHNFFQRMAAFEFDGFFRVGMHHRNERNAIIQHGTMTLIRRKALAETGGWAEWCICEDAELGLRLMHAGYETRYIDRVLGRGLTPSDFKAFKSQRMRWAFGAMQILKGRWSWLTKRGPLTAGQRFHFLTGWFSWFADALHFVFTMASLVWTIGMLMLPKHFTLPLDLFLVPVLGFFVAKALFGPLLYARRVDCGPKDVFGASLASMALSHAIARGVFEGLWRKQGVFIRTAKTAGQRGKLAAMLMVIREETLMLAALVLGAGLVAVLLQGQREALLWASILAAQALPYLSTLASAVISVRESTAPKKAAVPAGQAPAQPQRVPALATATA
ncbi:MAG: glycosyltransferase family 2 protein [Pseudomonadota bacterium]